jgi:hypothetical protein
MNAIEIIYPKFWVQPKVKHFFLAQLGILKTHYCHGKNIGANQIYISSLFNELKLKAQASFFKVMMLANSATTRKLPLDCNPCFKMWALLTIS